MAEIQAGSLTDDGGKVLGEGWVEYFDSSSELPFYVNDERGLTEWSYPIEFQGHDAGWDGDGSEGADERSIVEKGVFDESILSGNKEQTTLFTKVGDDASTDDSSDDDDDPSGLRERAARLGGGFRSAQLLYPPPSLSPERGEEEAEEVTVLGASSLAMMEKLNQTRAVQQGDVMSNQAAFKAEGMLMLESIDNKEDPNDEHEDDAEAIARLAGERVKMQDEMEQVRRHFTDQELFKLREEFNSVDADRSGYIDDDELKVLLTVLNDSKVPSESEVRRVMAEADASGDGQLDFLEFLALVKAMRDEKKANNSVFKSMAKLADTIKADVLGSVGQDLLEYKTRAYRFLNAEKVAKQERREAEKLRVKEEKAAAKAKIEADRAALVEEDEKEQEKEEVLKEETGLESTVLFQGNELDYPDEDDVVTVHIKMTTVSLEPGVAGDVLENSRKRRRPFKFKVNGGAVIPGALSRY